MKKQFNPDFLIIPYQLIEDKKLQPVDLKVFGIIYWYTNLKGGKCTASNASIAAQAKVSERTINESLLRLEEYGYIKRVFRDESKRNRINIICKVSYKVDTVDTVSNTANTVSNDTANTVQISNILEKNNNTTANAEEGFNFKEELERLKNNTRKDLKIIALYWKKKSWNFENKIQFSRALKRELRAAKDLMGYSGEQIGRSITFCMKEYPDKWTLETVFKRIQDLVNKSP